MKKIVTTIAALAMAVSMFAADVSAKVHIEGSLLNVADVVENTFLVFTKSAIQKIEEAYV